LRIVTGRIGTIVATAIHQSGGIQLALSGPNARGHYDGTFEAAHLSYWNLDWHYPGKCSVAQPIVITGNDGGAPVYFKLINTDTGQFFRSGRGGEDGRLVFRNAPSTIPMRVEGRWSAAGDPFGSTDIENLCQGGTLAMGSAPLTVDVTVSVTGTCPGQFEIRPTLTVWIRELGTLRWGIGGYLWDGVGVLRGLLLNQQYEVNAGLFVNGEEYWGQEVYTPGVDPVEFDITVELPGDICS